MCIDIGMKKFSEWLELKNEWWWNKEADNTHCEYCGVDLEKAGGGRWSPSTLIGYTKQAPRICRKCYEKYRERDNKGNPTGIKFSDEPGAGPGAERFDVRGRERGWFGYKKN
jgi:hypothetical protein